MKHPIQVQNADTSQKVCERVWISSIGSNQFKQLKKTN